MDYRNPEYSAVLIERNERLGDLYADDALLAATRQHYAEAPWDFVSDWGMTFDPRNIERGLSPTVPFVLWDRQVDYMKWVYARWQAGERGLVEKSRDCGVSWLSVGMAVSMWLFVPGFTIGFGSRKEELVDRLGDPKSIFEKARVFIDSVPAIFMPAGWDAKKCSAHMRLINPETGASITGEAGDNIGRGGRTSLYFVDEAAFIEHQELVDAALSQNTNCQIDISTPNGNGNAFYRKRIRFDGTDRVFIFDWRDDPRKDDAWYQRQVAEQEPAVVAQEVDRDYSASQEDSFIPVAWVRAAIDAHVKLGFRPSGMRVAGFDPADVGDAKAIVLRHGAVLREADELKVGDITHAIPWAIAKAEDFRADIFRYDADGMGAPAMKLATQNATGLRMLIQGYQGSGSVEDPDKFYGSDQRKEPGDMLKTNGDTFSNYRAQTWTWARDRFKATFDAITALNEGRMPMGDPEMMISIDSRCKRLRDLEAELSRPKRIYTPNGKIKVESKPDMKKRGVSSPNLADAAVIALATNRPAKKKTHINIRQRRVLDRAVGY